MEYYKEKNINEWILIDAFFYKFWMLKTEYLKFNIPK